MNQLPHRMTDFTSILLRYDNMGKRQFPPNNDPYQNKTQS